MKKITQALTDVVERILPDAFAFAIFLSILTIVLASLFGQGNLGQQVEFWASGLWDLNNFAMQMALILITGSTLARTSLVNGLLNRLLTFVRGPVSASIIVTIVTIVACIINWGLGLIVGALLAVKVAKKLEKANFALLLANAYSGFLVWHGGISGSIPLKLTDPSGVFGKFLNGPIALSETLGSRFNLTLLVGNILVILLVNIFLAKVFGQQSDVIALEELPSKSKSDGAVTFAAKVENSLIPILIVVALLVYFLITKLMQNFSFDLNLLIILFLTLSLLLSFNIKKFLENFNASVPAAAGILLQFPFYAAIMSVMSKSGIAASLSQFFISIASEKTFLFFTYLAAGILNFFVPSGGGQWAIQGPIIIPAAMELGVSISDAAMAIAWGDAWTNMIQPFWALPLLSLAGVKMQKLISYTAVVFLASGIYTGTICLLMS